jgi:ABC-2 type transport system ATP-binding protein
MDSKPILEFKNVRKIFRSSTVLNDCSFKIYNHEITAILGKSGSGKSTIIKLLLGLHKPESGEILYEGKHLNYGRGDFSSIVGYVSQENSFYEKLSVQENLTFFGKLYGVSKKDLEFRSKELLNLVKLTASKDLISEKLSGGMKRRLEFAISLIHNPHILILDEPFAGLDIEIREDLWNVLDKIRESEVTVIIITHLLSSVQKHANRALILHKFNIKKEVDLKSNVKDLESIFLEEVKK